LKIFVINLSSSVERLEKVTDQLASLELPFERFDAVDGRRSPHPLFARYDDQLRRRYRRTPMSPGELGCFASHFLLWQRCVEMGEPIVVLEDDVVIDPCFPQALRWAERIVNDFPYLRLAGTSLRKSPYAPVGTLGPFKLVDHLRGPTGTLCYVIHPRAAQKMLNASKRWCLAVDDHLDRYWQHGVDCFSLMPFPVKVGSNPSDIKRNEKDRRIWSVILRESFRRIEMWRRDHYRKKIQASKEQHLDQFFSQIDPQEGGRLTGEIRGD